MKTYALVRDKYKINILTCYTGDKAGRWLSPRVQSRHQEIQMF